jgi:copper(I)-binding protein
MRAMQSPIIEKAVARRLSGAFRKPLAALAALAILSVSAAAQPGPTGLEISAAWVRAMPPTQRMTAAYMTLRNSGDEVLTITGASAPGADASLHETRRDGERMRMAPVKTLTLGPGEQVVLAPGGLHIMLMSMVTVPVEGQTQQLCLELGEGRHCVDAPVYRDAPQSEVVEDSPGHAH